MRLVGDPIVLVVAETKYVAEDGAELVEVDYDDLRPVASSADALDPTSTPIFEDAGSNVLVNGRTSSHGDLDAVFAKADRVVRATIDQHRHQNVPMECRGSVSSFDPDTGMLTVHGSNQGVHLAKMTLCGQLGIAPDKVRVLCGDIGGSFGLKIGTSREDLACAAASRDLGRPVKWIEDRREHLMASGQAREESMIAEAAVTNEGDVLGLKVDMTVDTGAYPGMGAMISGLIESMLPGPYKMEALGFTFSATVTNKAQYVAYRGPWAAETFTRERLLDIVAHEVGIEPLELRLRNVVTRGEPPLADDHGPQPRRRHDPRVARAHGRDHRPAGVPRSSGRGARRGSPSRARRGHLHRGRTGPSRGGRRRRDDGPGADADAARARRHGLGVHVADAARPGARDDVRSDRGG